MERTSPDLTQSTPGAPSASGVSSEPGLDAALRDARVRMLHRIRGRIGHGLGRWVDPEDVLQEVCLSASSRREAMAGAERETWIAWILRCAERQILVTARRMRARVRPRRSTAMPASLFHYADGRLLDVARDEAGLGASRVSELDPRADWRGSLPRSSHVEVHSLRGLALSWETISFVMERSEAAARKLHGRAIDKLRS